MNELYDVDVSERAQPFDKNMRGELDLKDKELLLTVSSLETSVVDSNVKTYHDDTEHFTFEKKEKEEKVEEETSDDSYEKISILDLLGDDF